MVLKDLLIDLLQNKDPRFFEDLNMTQAVKKLKTVGIKTSFNTLKTELESLIGDQECYECGDGSGLYMNTPEQWEALNLKGKSEYYFQNF